MRYDGVVRVALEEDVMMTKDVLERLAVVAIALLLIVLAGDVSAGSTKGAAGPKRFYLTQDFFNGGQALTACAAPFHMASLWEILDPSNLKYDTSRGYINDDSGSGPPATTIGWIRTGGPATTGASFGGAANCNAWTSASSLDSGTVVDLLLGWNSAATVASPWQADAEPCDDARRVWCVQ